jgi:hypothetical protein
VWRLNGERQRSEQNSAPKMVPLLTLGCFHTAPAEPPNFSAKALSRPGELHLLLTDRAVLPFRGQRAAVGFHLRPGPAAAAPPPSTLHHHDTIRHAARRRGSTSLLPPPLTAGQLCASLSRLDELKRLVCKAVGLQCHCLPMRALPQPTPAGQRKTFRSLPSSQGGQAIFLFNKI